MITISKKLQIDFKEPFQKIGNSHIGDLYYNGDIFGMVYEGVPISKEDTFNKLSSSKNIDELIEILRFIVGPIWIAFKTDKKIILLSSTATPPLYFYGKNTLIFSPNESKVLKIAKEKEHINKDYLMGWLHKKQYYTYASFSNPPEHTLFENVFRMPGGHIMEIDSNNKYSYRTYLRTKPKMKVRYNYKYFKRVLESIAKLYADSGKKMVVYYSGGIDCTVIYLALKKHSNDVCLLTTTQDFDGSFDGGNAREITAIARNHLDFQIHENLLHADRYSKEQREIRDEQCKLNSFDAAGWECFIVYSVMNEYKNANDRIFFTGGEFETYGIAHIKIDFAPLPLLRAMIGRYFYTRGYQRNPDGWLNKKLRNKFAKDNIFLDKQFKNNREMRIFRHYTSNPNFCQLSYWRDKSSGQKTAGVGTDGPMVDFFINLQLGWRDVLIPKRFQYKYFKEQTGKHQFIVFNPLRKKQYHAKVMKEIQGDRTITRKVNIPGFVFSRVFQEDFFRYVDLDNPSVMKYIDDPHLKKVIFEYYDDAKRGTLSFNEIEYLYNLETFIKNLGDMEKYDYESEKNEKWFTNEELMEIIKES